MSPQKDVRKELDRLGQQREKAAQRQREIATELRAAIRRARREGVSVREIAKRSGLSRPGVYKFLADED